MQLEVIEKAPSGDARPTPLLFVHGAWHGAWCWEKNFLPYFTEQGYAVTAFSFRGHGDSEGHDRLRRTRLADYIADVEQVASRFASPPVIIAHSMGGLVAQNYLESHPARAAVLLASVPPRGAIGATLRYVRRHPLHFLKGNLTLSLYPLIETPELTRDAFFSATMPDDLVQAYFEKMQDESYFAFLDMLLFKLPHPQRVKVPMLVMGADNDRLFPRSEVEATARAYGTEAVVFPNMAHDMMLEEDWEGVAERIVGWLGEQGI
ncbi:MAG TPA: alpha/beta fold hydrolase [Ardenticatenaceae bacterium]|jgi:pimeloyl-ACP methyl ester carboxylesterase